MRVVFLILFFFTLSASIDIYFVRHAARSPLVVPMEEVFGVYKKQLTIPGKIQSYYYGKQLYARHFRSLPKLQIFATHFERTQTTAEYFLKGWYGIKQKGNYTFNPDPQYLPPSNISLLIFKQQHQVNEYEYSNLIMDLPYLEDITNREYRKYRISDRRNLRVLKMKIRQNWELCDKFEYHIPGSCTRMSINEYFNFVDIMNCLSFINKTVPDVSRQDMNLPLEIVNHSYNILFRSKSFPTRAVQQDFLLIQDIYNKKSADVSVIITHDTQMFYFLRSLLGVQGVMKMFKGNMVMNFLSSLHFQLSNGIAKMYFNDIEFHIDSCGTPCSIKKLFHLMNN